MTETQLISQLKFRVTSLESALSDRQREVEDLKGIQAQADSKIKAMTKIHNDKVKSLLNSIQILKKEKASLEGQSKQHKRSKLIEQLNKEIMDQDIVIDALRKKFYQNGIAKGRQICDQVIMDALKKGPERIRAVTREELRMEIQKLKLSTLNKTRGNEELKSKVKDFGEASQVSEISQQSFVNQNEEIFKKLKEIQTENQNLKLQISTKGKIIEKLKNETKQKDRLKSEVELLTNELQVSGRKVFTLQRLLRETKENMHIKIGELFERELKVQELQMNSKESGERLRQAHQSTNLLLQEIKQEKEQLQVEIDLLKKENEGLMLDKMSMKSRQDEQKKKIEQIREINSKNKEDLGKKLVQLEAQLQKLNQQNSRLTDITRELQMKYFKEREEWIQQRQKLTEEGLNAKVKYDQAQLQKSTMEQINNLRKQNRDLKQLLQSGGGTSADNKILLERLQNYRIRLEMYESKQGGKGRQRQLYDQLFDKYNNLLVEFEKLKKMVPSEKLKPKRLNIVQVTPNEEQRLNDISSGISDLGLDEIGSDILDNYDSSYEYELRVDEVDRKKFKGIPKITEEDKQLLKLISSDLWCFVKDDKVEVKLNEALDISDKLDEMEEEDLAERIRKIKNISHPQGTKFVVYDSQLKEMDEMSENVSITSAIQKEIDQYDSDVNIEVKKMVQGSPNINMRELKRISDSQSFESIGSSLNSGQSGFVKRKKGGEKASVIKFSKEKATESIVSSSSEGQMNSSVSSVGVNQSLLAEINSDVSMDFRKRKVKKH